MDDPHLLVVDDDARLRDLLATFLRRNGFIVTVARDAAQARALLQGLAFDLIVLDVMMPGEDGISLCHDLRARLSVPVLLLTARGETEDRIAGLEAGADDYLPKPFDPKELLLRLNAILRRSPAQAAPGPVALRFGAIRFDLDTAEMTRDGTPVRLTATEVQLMRIFAAHPGKTLSRAFLVGELGRAGDQAQERAVDVQITRLRRKIEDDPRQPRHLHTVRGEGYRLVTG